MHTLIDLSNTPETGLILNFKHSLKAEQHLLGAYLYKETQTTQYQGYTTSRILFLNQIQQAHWVLCIHSVHLLPSRIIFFLAEL